MVNITKCEFITKKLKILGHVIEDGMIKMDESKIEAISKRSAPINVKQIQQFTGLCNYYRKFVQNCAKIAAPMVKLTCKDTRWDWTPECQSSFEQLKQALVSSPVLRPPDFSRKFTIYTDASAYALGGILTQKDDNGNEYVVAYCSRQLKNGEPNLGITETECLAVVYAVKQFRAYIHGAPFDVVTDHSALKWLFSIRDPTGKLARWSIYLQFYQMTIIHRAGHLHVI